VILVDTSVWVDHLRAGKPALVHLLDHCLVLAHPWVTGELALGHLSQRQDILGLLTGLPSVEIATDAEVLGLIEAEQLYGLGIGGLGIEYVDAQLLAATRLTADARLWTADKRLAVVARRLRLLADLEVER
jgi:predicted nucleic acid-binding protein